MLYTQTSLSLAYNLEQVLKSRHCCSATYQFGIVACLRLEPKSYSTRLYSLHRRCSFGPVVSCCSGSRAALWVFRAVCRFSAPWSCLCAVCFSPWNWWLPEVAVAVCWSCSFGWGWGKWRCYPMLIMTLCCWRCALWRWAIWIWWWLACKPFPGLCVHTWTGRWSASAVAIRSLSLFTNRADRCSQISNLDSWCATHVSKTLDVVHRYALLVSNSDDDDDELMHNVLRCHLTY